MQAIQFFAEKAVTVVKVTHSDASKPYCFGKLVTWPDFDKLGDSVYIARKVARWSKRSIGVLFVPPHVAQEDLTVGQYVLVDLAKSSKGWLAQAILPPSWAGPVVQFFKLCSQPDSASLVSLVSLASLASLASSASSASLASLRDSLVVHYRGIQLDALFHALLVLCNDWTSIFSMMQVDQLSDWTSFDLIDQASKDYYDLIVASPAEFVCLMAVWCQNAGLIQQAADKLAQLVRTNNIKLTDQASKFVQQAKKHTLHCDRMLRQYEK